MSHELSLKEIKKEWHGTLRSYLTGFFTCLILTAASFYLVIAGFFSKTAITVAIILLALLQAAIQVRFFLHVGEEAKPRWETLLFFFMLLILGIVAIGSLWIIFDLNSRTMPMEMPMEMTHD
ncbi:MAG: cytochrome o ubiquinol oxidase subunit IV [Parachlamydia sp.]|nr:cytochrome o ubiquinol oxidase subunit IV [Parachlamydia sp.]